MNTEASSTEHKQHTSWIFMVIIALAQIQMSFNVSA